MTTVISRNRSLAALALLVAAVAIPGSRAQAQPEAQTRVVPTSNTVITGYGTVGYVYRTEGDNENEFTAALNPIFLFQFQDRFLFEVEFEFELEGGVTETGLEYANIDWLVNDNLVLVGGKFLLPFGVFGERLHPTWINKFPTAPPLYGHHVSEFGAAPLLPILSDVGFMARATVRPRQFNIGLNLFATQGPEAELAADPGEVPELEFPASSEDNNTNKMFGGRVDLMLPPWVELNISVINADYDEESFLDFTAWNVAAEGRYRGFEARGEYIQTRQEIETVAGFPVFRRHGFYAQISYRWRQWEPVLRWTQAFDDELEGVVTGEGASQAGFGLNYWFTPSISIMTGFELNKEDGPEIENDRLVAHVAYGF